MTCGWCGGPIPAGARRDSIYCGVGCRQAAHRAKVRRAQLEATARPLRLAYADPPYVGMARRYYGDHPDYRGEVDHAALLRELDGFDGWALSCSGPSVPQLAALAVADGRPVRLAVWHRRRPPHPNARILSSWEGVLYVPARDIVPGSSPTPDILLGVDAPTRRTLPGRVTGMKPPRFLEWLFTLLGAMPGDELVDMFPGSGMVSRGWAQWADEASRLETADG